MHFHVLQKWLPNVVTPETPTRVAGPEVFMSRSSPVLILRLSWTSVSIVLHLENSCSTRHFNSILDAEYFSVGTCICIQRCFTIICIPEELCVCAIGKWDSACHVHIILEIEEAEVKKLSIEIFCHRQQTKTYKYTHQVGVSGGWRVPSGDALVNLSP